MERNIILWLAIGLTALTNAQNEVQIDTGKSVISWTGSNLFKFNKHYGTVKFNVGTFTMDQDSIRGGSFEIDMNSIFNTDGDYNEMLVWHLKNPDFFDVEKYPTAQLEILDVKYSGDNKMMLTADLTIKKITRSIQINSTIEHNDNSLRMRSKFIIDRTRWNINFESKGLIGSAKDGIISDAIEFEVFVITKQPL